MTIREFIDAFQRTTSHGWLDWGEALLLVDWAERTRGPLVEIGSYMGRSAMLLAQLPRDEGRLIRRRLYCVDPWADGFSSGLSGDEVYRRFLANVASIPGADVVPVRCRVEDWEPVPAEFVYCDGRHDFDGTQAQLRAAKACGAKVVAVHDVNDSGDGLQIKRAAVSTLGAWRERIGRLAVWEVGR